MVLMAGADEVRRVEARGISLLDARLLPLKTSPTVIDMDGPRFVNSLRGPKGETIAAVRTTFAHLRKPNPGGMGRRRPG